MSHFHRALILIKTPTLRAEHSFKIDNFVVNIVLKENFGHFIETLSWMKKILCGKTLFILIEKIC